MCSNQLFINQPTKNKQMAANNDHLKPTVCDLWTFFNMNTENRIKSFAGGEGALMVIRAWPEKILLIFFGLVISLKTKSEGILTM